MPCQPQQGSIHNQRLILVLEIFFPERIKFGQLGKENLFICGPFFRWYIGVLLWKKNPTFFPIWLKYFFFFGESLQLILPYQGVSDRPHNIILPLWNLTCPLIYIFIWGFSRIWSRGVSICFQGFLKHFVSLMTFLICLPPFPSWPPRSQFCKWFTRNGHIWTGSASPWLWLWVFHNELDPRIVHELFNSMLWALRCRIHDKKRRHHPYSLFVMWKNWSTLTTSPPGL